MNYIKSAQEGEGLEELLRYDRWVMPQSMKLVERAGKIIPDHTQTASKAPRRFVRVAPKYIDHARGCWVWDVDGHKYLDTTMALGAVVLGYNDKDVSRAVKAQIDKGVLFTLPGRLEVEMAEELVAFWLPEELNMVRILKTGSEATSAAVRLARAVTGRSKIIVLKGGYHGWNSWFIASQKPGLGVTKGEKDDVAVVERGNIEALKLAMLTSSGPFKTRSPKSVCNVAAVIAEPIGLEEEIEWAEVGRYLSDVKQACKELGALLVFDEVLTGIRMAPDWRTMSARLEVVPDLMTLGKAMANGYPLAALAGKPEYMKHLNQDEVFVSGTYAGELVSLAAGKATLQKLRSLEPGVLLAAGNRMLEAVRQATIELAGMRVESEKGEVPAVRIRGHAHRFLLEFAHPYLRDLFQQECAWRGVLFTGAHNTALPHRDSKVLDTLRRAYEEASAEVRGKLGWVNGKAEEMGRFIEGGPTKPAFQRQG